MADAFGTVAEALSRRNKDVRRNITMIPVRELLQRIQWDPEFGKGRFTIGYYDRIEDQTVRIAFQRIHLARGQHFSFDVEGEDGKCHMVPYHRVREVWRDGKLIWQRGSRLAD